MGSSANSGFLIGALTGIAVAGVAVASAQPELAASLASTLPETTPMATQGWVATNLGASVWLFSAVLGLYLIDLTRLRGKLNRTGSGLRDVVGLDQRLDVWGQLFIGIGVVWTAIGMRSALQAALGDGDLSGSASSVLKNLVDGGILLALTTTIVGGVGGYLMRLAKTVTVGSDLQAFYEALDQAGVHALLKSTERIEQHLQALQPAPPTLREPA